MKIFARPVFVVSLLVSFGGLISAPVALALGIGYALCFSHPYPAASRSVAKLLLQAAVVALGFGMNLHQVLQAGRSGFIYTALGITFTLAAGFGLGRLFNVGRNASYLITAGTAICGGSAIAAIAPILDADDEDVAVALG